MPNHTKESKQKRKLRRKGEGERGYQLFGSADVAWGKGRGKGEGEKGTRVKGKGGAAYGVHTG